MVDSTEGYEPYEIGEAKDIAFSVLDGKFHGDEFYQDTENGPEPDFIGLSDSIVEALVEAGVQIPGDLKSPYRLEV